MYVGCLAQFDYNDKSREVIVTEVTDTFIRTVSLEGYRTFRLDRIQGGVETTPSFHPVTVNFAKSLRKMGYNVEVDDRSLGLTTIEELEAIRQHGYDRT